MSSVTRNRRPGICTAHRTIGKYLKSSKSDDLRNETVTIGRCETDGLYTLATNYQDKRTTRKLEKRL